MLRPDRFDSRISSLLRHAPTFSVDTGTDGQVIGTSMAAPVVSGAVALLLQKTHTLTPDQVKARLMRSAYKNPIPYSSVTDLVTGQIYNDQSDIFTVGAGYQDIQAALSDNTLSALSAKSPKAAHDRASNTFYMVLDASAVWGSNTHWGSASVGEQTSSPPQT